MSILLLVNEQRVIFHDEIESLNSFTKICCFILNTALFKRVQIRMIVGNVVVTREFIICSNSYTIKHLHTYTSSNSKHGMTNGDDRVIIVEC